MFIHQSSCISFYNSSTLFLYKQIYQNQIFDLNDFFNLAIYFIFSDPPTNTQVNYILSFCLLISFWNLLMICLIIYKLSDSFWIQIYLLGYGVLCHFQQYFSYIVTVSFIYGGNRRKPPTCRKSLSNFIIKCCIEYTSTEWD